MPIILTGAAGDSTVFNDISAALDGRLALMPSLPPVAWENKVYEPVVDVLFLRPTNIQGDTVAATGAQDETVGIYQVDVFAPTGEGKNAVVVMADMVADWLKQNTEITYLNQMVRVRSVSRGLIRSDENGWLSVNVDVTYDAFSDRR